METTDDPIIESIPQGLQMFIVLILNLSGYVYLAIHFFRFGELVQGFIFGSISITIFLVRIYQIRDLGDKSEILYFYARVFYKLINQWKMIVVIVIGIIVSMIYLPFLSEFFGEVEKYSFMYLLILFFFTILVEGIMNSIKKEDEEHQIIASEN